MPRDEYEKALATWKKAMKPSEDYDTLQAIANGETTKNTHDLARALLALPPKDLNHQEPFDNDCIVLALSIFK
jgi:hypothetical protein